MKRIKRIKRNSENCSLLFWILWLIFWPVYYRYTNEIKFQDHVNETFVKKKYLERVCAQIRVSQTFYFYKTNVPLRTTVVFWFSEDTPFWYDKLFTLLHIQILYMLKIVNTEIM